MLKHRIPFLLRLAFSGVIVLPLAAETLSSPVKLQDTYVTRGDTIHLNWQTGPTEEKPAKILLIRKGVSKELKAQYAPSKGQTAGVLTASVPDDLEYGKYAVRPFLGDAPILQNAQTVGVVTVGPPGGGAITLEKFTPAGTYDVKPFFVKPKEKMNTVDVVLRGQGFPEGEAAKAVSIWINGSRIDNLKWDGDCKGAPTPENARQHQIDVQVKSDREVRLCSVPVPSDGKLAFRAGIADTLSEAQILDVYRLNTTGVALISGSLAALLALLPIFILSLAHTGYRIGGVDYQARMLFLDPETDTYSLSKLQFYLWTVAAIFAYAYLFISRVYVQETGTWPDVPYNLPGIILMAAGTAIGAQMVTSSKGSKGAGAEAPSLADFITSGGVVAPDRFQMFVWTLAGVAAFVYAVLQKSPGLISELPTVPSNLLVMMGISSAGYLGGKIARKAGPVINQISLDPADSDAAIRQQSAPAADMPDIIGPVLRAKAELAQLTAANTDAKAAIATLKAACDAASSAHTPSEFNKLVADLAESRDTAEAAALRVANDFAADKAPAEDAQAAQRAAAALQDLAADVTTAIAAAALAPIVAEMAPAFITRTIELRGTNLSPEGMVEIDNADLSFKMLFNREGDNAPDVISRDDVNPTFAKVLRLVIDPARLSGSQQEQFLKWFATDGAHTFSLLNPDGQRADVTFNVPPATAQKLGTTK